MRGSALLVAAPSVHVRTNECAVGIIRGMARGVEPFHAPHRRGDPRSWRWECAIAGVYVRIDQFCLSDLPRGGGVKPGERVKLPAAVCKLYEAVEESKAAYP